MQSLLERVDLEALITAVATYLPNVLVAFLILLGFWMAFRVSRPWLSMALTRAGFHQALVGLLVDSIYKTTLAIFAVVMAADQLGVNVAAALAGIGVVGVALGFAAQTSLANLIAGFLIFWDKPFQVGDFVTVAGEYGRIGEITLRSTRIRTPQNTWVIIPNRTILDEVMVNHSHQGALRVDVPLGIAYKENIPEARRVLLRAVQGIGQAEPAPDVVVCELGDSSVELRVRVWIEDAAGEKATFHQVLEVSKLALDEAGIQIPFPHLQLFVDDVEDRVWQKAQEVGGRG